MKQIKNTDLQITKEDTRDYLFDNMRAILIILVVLAHVLTERIHQSDMIKSIYTFIYFFHMPALTFVSGYFSKKLEKSRATAFEKLLLPYIIVSVITYFFVLIINGGDYVQIRMLHPYRGLWYLLALFLWKVFLKDLVRIRFILPFSFIIALLSGYSKEFSEFMAVERLLCFLPFFLLGYYCTSEFINKIRKLSKFISIIVISAVGVLSVSLLNDKIFKGESLYFRKPYSLKESNYEEMLCRILVYIVAIITTVAIINLMSRKKGFLSKIGRSTMPIYVFHLIVLRYLQEYEILEGQPYLYILYAILLTVLMVYLFSRPMVNKIYEAGMDKTTRLIMKKS